VSDTDALGALTGDEKRALLMRLASKPRQFPLSFAQRRLWFLDQLVPGSASYNMDTALRLRMPLDVDALVRSLNEIVQRHGSLRTTFRAVDGEPVQVVAPELEIVIPVIDLGGLDETRREAEAVRLATEEARRPFDLAEGPLIRASLLRLGADHYIFLLTLHHIVSDGWSMEVLFRELSELYAAYAAGQSSALAELPIQYVDYAVWQRQWLQGTVRDQQLAYWKKQLAGVVPLELPTDRPRPPVQSFEGAYHALTLPPRIVEGLRRLAQAEDATLFMVLLAAFQLLLARYSSQQDIAVGSPIAGRNRAETEGLIGFFVNTLVLRIDLSDDPTFRELLRRVREVALGGYAHQDLPFEILVDEFQPQRDLSHTPLFQVGFSLQNRIGDESQLLRRPRQDQNTVSALVVQAGTAKFDLTLLAEEARDGVSLVFEYRTDLFEHDSVRRLASHYVTLLHGVIADPTSRVWRLPLLNAAERTQLLTEWGHTETAAVRFECVHRMFEAQARNHPDAPALVFGNERLTYADVNAQANRLAYYLQSAGVGVDARVGICIRRSPDMIVALLATMKAGGAYVPLDPEYPDERLAFMVADADLHVVLSEQQLAPRLAKWCDRVVSVDATRDAIAALPVQNPLSDVTGDDLAYVIYTSGSTGRPKGVQITHRSVCNVADAALQLLPLLPSDRVLQFASLSFDASVCEMLMAWSSGAALCVGTREELLPGPPLASFMRDQKVSAVLLPPSALSMLSPDDIPDVRTVCVCGEAFHADLVERWAPGRGFFNLYGPTESTIFVTAAECRNGRRRPEIGRPIRNSEAFVLDRHGEPVPIGVPGELYVGGAGLARGYLKRPELTAERFVRHPFNADLSARLYRTGDLVRFLPDGRLEFLGRVDQQVKVRGFRIELSEIESTLAEHPDLRDVVVLAREDRPGDKRLVAYVVGRSSEPPSAATLREFLKLRLPAYMLPSAFVALDRMPVLPSGKIDRLALPAPDGVRPDGEAFVAPRTALERSVSELWQELLEIDRIGIDDNFFDLGGHSLLIVRLQAKLQRVFSRQLSIIELFQFPTVRTLAGHLAGSAKSDVDEEPAFADAVGRAERRRETSRRRGQLREGTATQ